MSPFYRAHVATFLAAIPPNSHLNFSIRPHNTNVVLSHLRVVGNHDITHPNLATESPQHTHYVGDVHRPLRGIVPVQTPPDLPLPIGRSNGAHTSPTDVGNTVFQEARNHDTTISCPYHVHSQRWVSPFCPPQNEPRNSSNKRRYTNTADNAKSRREGRTGTSGILHFVRHPFGPNNGAVFRLPPHQVTALPTRSQAPPPTRRFLAACGPLLKLHRANRAPDKRVHPEALRFAAAPSLIIESEHAHPHCGHHRFKARPHVQLPAQVRRVVTHRMRAQPHLRRNVHHVPGQRQLAALQPLAPSTARSPRLPPFPT